MSRVHSFLTNRVASYCACVRLQTNLVLSPLFVRSATASPHPSRAYYLLSLPVLRFLTSFFRFSFYTTYVRAFSNIMFCGIENAVSIILYSLLGPRLFDFPRPL